MDATQTYTVVDTLEREHTRQDSNNDPASFMTNRKWMVVKVLGVVLCVAIVCAVVIFVTRNTWKRPSDVSDFLEEKEKEEMLKKSELESKGDDEKRTMERESLLRYV